jgi:hypothetical protein
MLGYVLWRVESLIIYVLVLSLFPSELSSWGGGRGLSLARFRRSCRFDRSGLRELNVLTLAHFTQSLTCGTSARLKVLRYAKKG